MSLQFRTFRIPCYSNSEEESECNRFLRSVTVLTVHRNFVADGALSFLLLTVEYLSTGQSISKTGKKQKPKIDYREVLSEKDFLLFSRMRDWRKDTAAKEAIAVYNIFTNEQLGQFASTRPQNKSAMGEIAGVGQGKVEKYAQDILALISQEIAQQARS